MKPKIQIEPSELRTHWNPDPKTKRSFPTIPGVNETDQICEECGSTYSALTLNGILWTSGRCIPCSEEYVKNHEDEELRGSFEKRKQTFKEKCPEKYHDFQRSLLPNLEAYSKVMEWEPSPKGLLLSGQSETGKTRSAWRLMNQLYVVNSIPFEAITELQFSHEVAKFGKSEALTQWIKHLCNAKILFIDDLGKCVMTERVVSEMFYIFEERMSHNRPIIVTMQIDSENFLAKISSRAGREMGEAIMNRLKTNCEIVQF